jgi:two-component system sensor histidine kinase KdpD
MRQPQAKRTRLLLIGALMFATLFMVALNYTLQDFTTSILTFALSVFVAVLILVGLFALGYLEERWDRQQTTLRAITESNDQLMKRISQRADQLATLNQVTALLTQSLSLTDVLDTIVSSTALIAQADAVAVFLEEDNHLKLARYAGFNGTSPLGLAPLTQLSTTNFSPLVCQVARDERLASQRSALQLQRVQVVLELPLAQAGKLVGVLVCYFRQARSFSEDDMGVLTSFAAQLANTLHNAREFERTDKELDAKTENLKAILDARDTYTQMLVHDLRSPLTAVNTSLKLIEETVPRDSEAYPMIERLTGTSARALRKVLSRVTAILDIARMESGVMSLKREPTDIAVLIGNVVSELTPIAQELNIALVVDIAPTVPPLALDADKIERAILNLVDNALKYAPAQSAVTVRATQPTPQTLRLDVMDKGKGIPDHYKQRLFDRFVQVEGRQIVRKGVGLGLSLCKAVAEAHGGSIHIEDNDGGGSVFRVELPITTTP